MHHRWLKIALIVFAGGIVIRALAERRPDNLYLVSIIAAIGIAVVVMGWLFATRNQR